MRKIRTLLIGVVVLAGASAAMITPASATPSITGYHSHGDVANAGALEWCIAAQGLNDHQPLLQERCLEHDAMEVWDATQVHGALITWCLAAHPLWCVAGQPINRLGQAGLYYTADEPDLMQGLNIYGQFVLFGNPHGYLNRIRNLRQRWLTSPNGGGGGPLTWQRRGAKIKVGTQTFGQNQQFVFTDGWNAVTVD